MCEGYTASVERYAAVWVRARRAVFEVSFNRAAQVGELAADLVVTSGEKFHLHEPISVSLADLLIVQLGKLGILSRRSGTADI